MPNADLLIAATAIANNKTLITRDRGFERALDMELRLEVRS